MSLVRIRRPPVGQIVVVIKVGKTNVVLLIAPPSPLQFGAHDQDFISWAAVGGGGRRQWSDYTRSWKTRS